MNALYSEYFFDSLIVINGKVDYFFYRKIILLKYWI